jgi:hypothetical protein
LKEVVGFVVCWSGGFSCFGVWSGKDEEEEDRGGGCNAPLMYGWYWERCMRHSFRFFGIVAVGTKGP